MWFNILLLILIIALFLRQLSSDGEIEKLKKELEKLTPKETVDQDLVLPNNELDEQRISQPPVIFIPNDNVVKQHGNSTDNIESENIIIQPNILSVVVRKIAKYWLGGNLIAKLGVLIIFVGVIYLLRYSVTHSLLTPLVRLLMIEVLSVTFFLTALWLFKKQRIFSLILCGGGFGIQYLSLFIVHYLQLFNFSLYGYWGLLIACALIMLVTAIRVNSQALATLALLGGFVVPVGLHAYFSSQQINLVLAYYLLLNFLVAIFSFRYRWSYLNFIGFIYTFGFTLIAIACNMEPITMLQAKIIQGYILGFLLLYLLVNHKTNKNRFVYRYSLQHLFIWLIPLATTVVQFSVAEFYFTMIPHYATYLFALFAVVYWILWMAERAEFSDLQQSYFITAGFYTVLSILLLTPLRFGLCIAELVVLLLLLAPYPLKELVRNRLLRLVILFSIVESSCWLFSDLTFWLMVFSIVFFSVKSICLYKIIGYNKNKIDGSKKYNILLLPILQMVFLVFQLLLVNYWYEWLIILFLTVLLLIQEYDRRQIRPSRAFIPVIATLISIVWGGFYWLNLPQTYSYVILAILIISLNYIIIYRNNSSSKMNSLLAHFFNFSTILIVLNTGIKYINIYILHADNLGMVVIGLIANLLIMKIYVYFIRFRLPIVTKSLQYLYQSLIPLIWFDLIGIYVCVYLILNSIHMFIDNEYLRHFEIILLIGATLYYDWYKILLSLWLEIKGQFKRFGCLFVYLSKVVRYFEVGFFGIIFNNIFAVFSYGLLQLGMSNNLFQILLSLNWLLVSLVALIYSYRIRSRIYWFSGICLFILAFIKLIYLDVNANSLYKIFALLGCGILLLILGYFYPAPPPRKRLSS